MKRRNKFIAVCSLLISGGAFAGEKGGLAATTCAVLEKWNGSLQILDEARTDLIDPEEEAAIPCGAWITAKRGAAVFKHRDGHRFMLTSPTLLSIQSSGDIITLYRGQVLVEVADGAPEFKMVTANGRAKSPHGSALVTYDEEAQETQVVALERDFTLENRFETKAFMLAKAGEATQLNLKHLRIVPTRAQVVAAASLRERLSLFPLEDSQKVKLVKVAGFQLEKKTGTTLVKKAPVAHEVAEQRKPASIASEPVVEKLEPHDKGKLIEDLSKIKPE